MNKVTMRISRSVCLIITFILFFSYLETSAYADNSYTIESKNYELSDGVSFNIEGVSSKSTLCYGANSIGSLKVSGSVNEQSTYNSYNAIGAYGEVALTYSYNGVYQTGSKEQWNLSSSNAKTVNGIDLGKKVEKGAIIVERSYDGRQWETVSVQTNVFHKVDSDISSFYTICDADVRNGTYFRVTLAYRMQRKTGTERSLGIFSTDVYEYREFVEIRDFYVCYNKNPITLRDIESGEVITNRRATKGFILDMSGTAVKVTVKDTEVGTERAVADLMSIIDRGNYQITVITHLGNRFTQSINVSEGMEMTAVLPTIVGNEKYELEGTSGNIPFGMSSLTALKIRHQENSRVATGTVSGFDAYGITGDSVSLFLRIRDFSTAEKNGWSISSDTWGKKEKQTVAGTWSGGVGTGALVVQTSRDGKEWEDVSQGKYANGLYTTDYYTHYSDQGDVLIYTPDGSELLNGIYIRVVYAYKVGRNGKKKESRILETYEFYLCSNELGAVTFKNLSASQNLEEMLGLDNESDVTV